MTDIGGSVSPLPTVPARRQLESPSPGAGPAQDPFGTLSQDHELALYRVALLHCRNAADAWDLVQDVFERALRKRPPVKSRQELRSWLIVVLHNRFVDGRRADGGRRVTSVDLEAIPAVAAHEPRPLWRELGMEEVLPLLPRLGSNVRDVFVLHVAGDDVSEIAKRLGLAPSKVSSRLFRARRQIGEMLRLQFSDARDAHQFGLQDLQRRPL